MSEEVEVEEIAVESVPDLETTPVPEVKEAERTFTQSELDAIVSKRLAKESRKVTRQAELEAENRILREQSNRREPEKVVGEPAPDNYSTTEDYLDARAEWIADRKIEAKLSELERNQTANEEAKNRNKAISDWQGRAEKAAAKHSDYDEALENVDHIKIPPMTQTAIMESEVGAEIAYYLAKHPDELEKIVNLKPHAALMALGRIESKLTDTIEAKKATTKVPEPISPLRGKSGAVNVGYNPDDDYKTFLHKRNIELGRIK